MRYGRLFIFVGLVTTIILSCGGFDFSFESDPNDYYPTYDPPKDCGDKYCDFCFQGDCICNYWDKRSIELIANNHCGLTISADDCLQVIDEAIDFWNAPDCSDMHLELRAVIYNASQFYRTTPPIIFHKSDWPWEEGTIYSVTLGHGLYDDEYSSAKIDINCENFRCTYDHLYTTLIPALGALLNVDDVDNLCTKYPKDEKSPCKGGWF